MASRVGSRLIALTLTVSMLASSFYIWRDAPPRHELEPSKSSVGDGNVTVGGSANVTTVTSRIDLARRSDFILKVYSTTMLNLATTGVVAGLVASVAVPEKDCEFGYEGCSLRHRIFDVLISTPSRCLLIMITFAVLTNLIIWRFDPWMSLNLFEAFAVLMGCWLGLACAFVSRVIVASALALTFSIFAVLTVISLSLTALGADFGPMEPVLAELLNLVIWFAIMRLALGLEKEAIHAVGGICLFSAYVLFDSNRIVRRYRDDEYVAGALDLYLDIINLFLDILDLMMRFSKK